MSQMLNLPIIDIAPYLKSDRPVDIAARKATSEALHSACLNFGFFYLTISEFVDPAIPEELATLAREFFSLPQAEKDKLSLSNQDNARGYARLKENVTNGKADNHEGIDFYRPVENPDKSKPLWGENQFPDVPGFKDKYEAWVDKMKALGLIVMEAMAIGLGMTPDEWQDLRSQVDDSFWVMRAIGYPPLPEDSDGFSCGAHKDYGCLTFLHADPTPSALQVFLRQTGGSTVPDTTGLPVEQGAEDGVWINADPIPGCCVCNIGEMWEIWSNGLYKSTLHRVVHRSTNYRISVPFFFEPNFDAHVKPLAAAKRIQGPGSVPEKQPVVYGEFLMAKVGNNFAGGKGKYDD
ncbi:Clavaminate synthase-like protein [Mycena epipterygia]|nr:Clavaminate synthase-like protein [Mycena epipterygia]